MKFNAYRGAILGSALAAVVAFAPGASASGPETGQPPSSWTGAYVGIHIGGAWSEVNWDNVSLTGEPVSNDASGAIIGGQIGYNVQYGRLVLGIEAALSGSALRDTVPSAIGGGITFSSNIDWIGTLTGRVGYAGDHWLVYGKGGLAIAGLELRGNNPGFPDSFSLDERASGWVIGAGLEWKLNRHMSLAVEYNYIDLGTFDASGTTTAGLPFTISDVDAQVQSITARLNVRLGQ